MGGTLSAGTEPLALTAAPWTVLAHPVVSAPNGVIHTDVCSQCHPFYTGKQKILDTGGRVARFEKRFGTKVIGTKAGKK